MLATAKLKYLRIAPRKVRLVADLVRGETAERAQVVLNFTRKKAALPILKLLNQAVANAKNTLQVDEKNLYISKITVDEGIKLKRYLPRARGKADVMHKKTSHITIVLDEIKPGAEKKARKKIKKQETDKKIKTKKPAAKEIEPKEKEPKKEEKEIKIKTKRPRPKQEFQRLKTKKQKSLKRFFRRKVF